MLGFGFPEWAGRGDLRDHFARPKAGGVHVRDRVFSDRALFVGRVEDRRPVTGADVVALPVLRRRVVDLEEELEQVAVRDLLGIELDLYGFGVVAMVAVRRVRDVAARVTDPRRDHARPLSDEILHPPKATPGEDGGFRRFRHHRAPLAPTYNLEPNHLDRTREPRATPARPFACARAGKLRGGTSS